MAININVHPVASSVKTIDFVELIQQAPKAKRQALWAAAETSTSVNDFIQMIRISGIGAATDAWVIDGVSALVTAGVIPQSYADKLLGV